MSIVATIGYYQQSACDLSYVHGFHDIEANPLDPLYVTSSDVQEQITAIQKISENKPYDDQDTGDKYAGNGIERFSGGSVHLAGLGLYPAGSGYTSSFAGAGLHGLGAYSECKPCDQNEGQGIVDVIEDDAREVRAKVVKPMKQKLNRLKQFPIKREAKLKKLKPVLPGQKLKQSIIKQTKYGSKKGGGKNPPSITGSKTSWSKTRPWWYTGSGEAQQGKKKKVSPAVRNLIKRLKKM